MTEADYQKLEAIHSMLLNYLDAEKAAMDDVSDIDGDIADSLYLVEEIRESYLTQTGVTNEISC